MADLSLQEVQQLTSGAALAFPLPLGSLTAISPTPPSMACPCLSACRRRWGFVQRAWEGSAAQQLTQQQRQGSANAGSAHALSDGRSREASRSRCTGQQTSRRVGHGSAAGLPPMDFCSSPSPCMTYLWRDRAVAACGGLLASIHPHSLRQSLHTGECVSVLMSFHRFDTIRRRSL